MAFSHTYCTPTLTQHLHSICTCNDADDRLETALSDEQEGNVKVMLEIKSALEGMVNIEGFTRSELQCLYDTVSVIQLTFHNTSPNEDDTKQCNDYINNLIDVPCSTLY